MATDILIDVFDFPVWQDAHLVPIELLVEPEWNANEMSPEIFNALVDEIQANGFDEPCQVVPIPGEKKFLVVGGAHRSRAARVLKMTSVPCCYKDSLDPKDIAELQAYSIRRNNIKGQLNAEKVQKVEDHLVAAWKKSSAAVRRRLLLAGQSLHKKTTSPATKTETVPPSMEAMASEGDGVPKDRPFIPSPKKGTPEAEQATEKAVDLAEKHRMLASVTALAKTIMANTENDESLEHGYLFFAHGGRSHLVVEMSPGLMTAVKALVKIFKADKAPIDAFLEKQIQAGVNAIKEEKSSKKGQVAA